MDFIEQLEKYKKANGIRTDCDVGKRLKISAQTIKQWRSSDRMPDVYACIRLALETDVDPLLLIAAVQKGTAKGERATFWGDFFRRVSRHGKVTTALICIAIYATALPSPADAADYCKVGGKNPYISSHYTKWLRQVLSQIRVWWQRLNLTHETKLQCY